MPSTSSVAKWALGAMTLIALSQLVIFLAVSHVAHKALEEAKAGSGSSSSSSSSSAAQHSDDATTSEHGGNTIGSNGGGGGGGGADAFQALNSMLEKERAQFHAQQELDGVEVKDHGPTASKDDSSSAVSDSDTKPVEEKPANPEDHPAQKRPHVTPESSENDLPPTTTTDNGPKQDAIPGNNVAEHTEKNEGHISKGDNTDDGPRFHLQARVPITLPPLVVPLGGDDNEDSSEHQQGAPPKKHKNEQQHHHRHKSEQQEEEKEYLQETAAPNDEKKKEAADEEKEEVHKASSHEQESPIAQAGKKQQKDMAEYNALKHRQQEAERERERAIQAQAAKNVQQAKRKAAIQISDDDDGGSDNDDPKDVAEEEVTEEPKKRKAITGRGKKRTAEDDGESEKSAPPHQRKENDSSAKVQPNLSGRGTGGADKPVDLLDTYHDIHSKAPVLSKAQKEGHPLLNADSVPEQLTHLKNAALLVLCYDRADYLTQTLKGVEAAKLSKNIEKYISQDGDEFETAAVAESFDKFKYMSHPRTLPEQIKQNTTDPELMMKQTPSTMYLAAHYKWALDKIFISNKHSHVIIIEDDMVVSKDFFQFFEMLAPLLDLDPTLWCVSSWNDNGFKHFDLDATKLFRTSYFPGLGWMMKRELWLELRDSFPEDNWDHWMRATTTSKNRECVTPFVSRNKNIGVGGATSNKQFYQQYLETIKTFKGKNGVALGDLSYLLHDEYYSTVEKLTSLKATGGDDDGDDQDDDDGEDTTSAKKRRHRRRHAKPQVIAVGNVAQHGLHNFVRGNTYLIPYVKEEYENLAMQLQLHPAPRTHFRHATWLHINGADVFLINKRLSPFAADVFRKKPAATLTAFKARKAGLDCNQVCSDANYAPPAKKKKSGDGDDDDEDATPKGWKCAPEQFDFINDCLVLAKFFDGCPYGCTQGWGEDIPAMENWEIGHNPQCLTTEVSPTCDAQFSHTQRLCPCVAQVIPKHNKHLVAVPALSTNSDCNEVCGAYDGNTPPSKFKEDKEDGVKWQCDEQQFQFINSCSMLKRNFECTTCDQNFGQDMPNFVVNKNDNNYKKCLMMKGDMTCSGSHKNTKRLCPCVPRP